MSDSRPHAPQECALRRLPAYLGTETLLRTLQTTRGRRIFWRSSWGNPISPRILCW
jgi:hypothetical protein